MLFLIIFFGFLPSFAWLFFFLKEDVHPEPKKMIVKVFIVGALATVLVFAIQYLLLDFLKFIQLSKNGLVSFALLSVIEEVFKFLAAFLIVKKSRFFDEPVDAMIYMVVAALGFAAAENLGIMLSLSNISEIFGAIIIRFTGATLLHSLCSAMVGYYWAKGNIQMARRKNANSNNIFKFANESKDKLINWNYIIKGLIFASLLHTIFNYFILIFKENALAYQIIFLIITALFVLWNFKRIKNF